MAVFNPEALNTTDPDALSLIILQKISLQNIHLVIERTLI